MLTQIVKRGRNTKAGLGYTEPQITKETTNITSAAQPHQIELKTVGELMAENEGLKNREILIYKEYMDQKLKN